MSEDDKKGPVTGLVSDAIGVASDTVQLGSHAIDKISTGGQVVCRAINKVYDDAFSLPIQAWSEAKSNKTKAEGDIAKTKGDIKNQQLRAAGMRVIAREARAYENVMKIGALAAKSIPENVPEGNIKEPSVDWMTSWTEFAGRVSEEQVQSLWAGILAGKVQKTGSFPLRTLSIVRDMDKDAAEKFINFCHFVTDELGYWGSIKALIYDAVEARAIYDNQGVRFDLQNEMISLGLLVKSSHSNRSEISEILFSYRGEHVIVNRKHNETLKQYEVQLGDICLTSAGKELFSLIRKTHEVKNLAFWQYLLNKWETDGLQPRKVSIEEANAVLASLGHPPLE